MAWKGIVGKSFTPAAFEAHVAGLKFGAWRPRFIVVHNTSAPDTKTWQGWQARKPPISDEKWMQNLVGYYRDDQKWSSGPHLFVTPGAINVFTPLTGPGTHSPSWNAISWGIETVGEFERDPFAGRVRTNLIASLAILHAAAGLQPRPYTVGVRGLHFHKEDSKTTHRTCPGRNMVKADLVAAIEAKIIELHTGEHTVEKIKEVPPVRTGVVNAADGLSLRTEASAKAPLVKTLKKGTKINITGEAKNGDTLWLATDGGFVSARYVDRAA